MIPPKLYTPFVKGKPFRCSCGCNVFFKPDPVERTNVYECNACGQWYEGEPIMGGVACTA